MRWRCSLVVHGRASRRSAATWLLHAQCPDGGWAFDEPYDPSQTMPIVRRRELGLLHSDSNTTGYVVHGARREGVHRLERRARSRSSTRCATP